MKRIIVVLAMTTVLSNCTMIRGYESVIEGYRKEGVDELFARICKMPIDWILDVAESKGDDFSLGYLAMCPRIKAAVEKMSRAKSIDPTVQMLIEKLTEK